jgi:predicted DNA-binding transcriptional regulator AlpA
MNSQDPLRINLKPEENQETQSSPDWDTFPDRLVSKAVVRKLRGGISSMSVWRHVRSGILPKPIMIAGRAYWRLGDIIASNSGKGEAQ